MVVSMRFVSSAVGLSMSLVQCYGQPPTMAIDSTLKAVAPLAQTQEQDVKGWTAAIWGMSLQQLREAFPNAAAVKPPKRLAPIVVRLHCADVKIGMFAASANFIFPRDQDHLTAVQVTVGSEKSNLDRANAFDVLNRSLTEKYGQRTTSDTISAKLSRADEITRTVTWRLPSTMITLRWYELGPGSLVNPWGMVSVEYTERKSDKTL